MIESGQSILQFAGTTAAIGMGVVFAALLLLSVYMHYFKVLIARVEGRHREGQPAEVDRVPESTKKPGQAPGDDAGVASAIAVGLRLYGAGGAPGGGVAAAIATAIKLQRERLRNALQPRRGAAHWPISGRLEMMSGRVRRQER